MKSINLSIYISNYLAKYLPGIAGLSTNTILSYSVNSHFKLGNFLILKYLDYIKTECYSQINQENTLLILKLS